MAFNVTQCPACESTFNTNARILESAAGRVRCGACLLVFDAEKNYIDDDDSDTNFAAEESVFVGNNPQEFFDPSQFLTRSALTEIDEPPAFAQKEESDSIELVDSFDPISLSADDFFDDAAPSLPSEIESTQEAILEPPRQAKQKPEILVNVADYESLIEEPPLEQVNEQSREQANTHHEAPDSLATETADLDESESLRKISDSVEAVEAINVIDHSDQVPEHYDLTASSSNTAELDSDFLSGAFDHSDQVQEHYDVTGSASNTTELNSSSVSEAFTASDQAPESSDLIGSASDAAELDSSSVSDAAAKLPILDWPTLDGAAAFTEDSEQEDRKQEEAATDSALEPVTNKQPEAEQFFESMPHGENAEQESTAADAPDDAADSDQNTEQQDKDSSAAIRARALETELEDENALEAISKENLAVLSEMTAPLELLRKSKSQWARRITLSFAIVFLGASLSAQYLWQHLDVYGQQADMRPFYELSCSWFGCELPSYSEISAIQSDKLAVQNHPELANGLLVNTILRNTADFPQAFPIMVLSFNTASNAVVALREFSPNEYLPPALQSFSNMPAMTPVQVELEIIDPGPDAVNYTLAFRLP